MNSQLDAKTGIRLSVKDAFKGGKAFIPFITCGDPNIETTELIISGMQDAGADLIELGIPFSDPTAEGPVIQEANLRALGNGVTTDDIFDMVDRIRHGETIDGGKIDPITVPLVIMTYANVIFGYGPDRFMERASEVGIQGIIVPDAPFEEKGEFDAACKAHGIDQISMIAPTSVDRIREIAQDADGFLYCVSSLGVTGVRDSITTDVASLVGKVRETSDIPCAIGFGISTPEQAREMAKAADGVIVGSAIVRMCGQYGRDAVRPICEYVAEMKDAIR